MDENFVVDIKQIEALIKGNGPILSVDDDEDQQFILKRCYEKSNKTNELVFLSNGNELLDFMQDTLNHKKPLPELILLDINMPGANGFDALKEIRSKDMFKDIPLVIMLTTSASPKDIKTSEQIGANAYWVKPMSNDEYIEFFNKV